jgi:two-component system NtrC family response regulator
MVGKITKLSYFEKKDRIEEGTHMGISGRGREDQGKKSATVLIVDDEASARIGGRRLLTHNPEIQDSVEILEAESVPEALSILAQHSVDVVFLDKNVGTDEGNVSQNGIESIPEMLKLRPATQILMITGSDDEQDRTRALELGAREYLVKSDPKEVRQRKVAQAILLARAVVDRAAGERLRNPFPKKSDVQLGGKSKGWKRSVAKALQFAANDFPVLIQGQTGTGKTELAKVIYCERERLLPNEAKRFIEVNMAAISPELADREFFGNEPGAFTGASSKTNFGYLDFASDGVLFLDEIGDATPKLQQMLLKVLEEKKFYRVGGQKEIHVQFKLICATHRNLEQMVKDGTFREDLYERISILTTYVPPLSERKEDAPEIIQAVLPRICKAARVEVRFQDLPESFVDYLIETPFSGNVRGMIKRVARLVVLAPEDRKGKKVMTNWKRILELDELAASEPSKPDSINYDQLLGSSFSLIGPDFPGINEAVSVFQMRIYQEAKEKFKKNNAIARALKVSRSTASENLRKMGAVKKALAKDVEGAEEP